MTNQFTDEQLLAALNARQDEERRQMRLLPGDVSTSLNDWGGQAKGQMRAALEAAAGVAPQAPSTSIEQALGFLDHLNAQNHIDWTSYSRLHDLISTIPSVQPSSTVDEGKLADVIAAHEMTSWGSRKWSGCECGEVYEVCPEGIVKWHANHRARAVVEAIGGEGRG